MGHGASIALKAALADQFPTSDDPIPPLLQDLTRLEELVSVRLMEEEEDDDDDDDDIDDNETLGTPFS